MNEVQKKAQDSLIKFLDRDLDINWMGERYRTSKDKRLKKSKFAKVITEMTDNEFKIFMLAFFGHDKVWQAITLFNQSVEHSTQLIALQDEINKRYDNKTKLLGV
jgi:hypothetical protein